MSNEQLLLILKEEGYPSYMFGSTIEKLNNLSSLLMASFEKWYQTGLPPKNEICGYSFEKLIQEYDMKPVGAFLTLDWLIREPEKAKSVLNKRIR